MPPEEKIALGSVGQLDIALSAGMISLTVGASGAVPGTPIQVGANGFAKTPTADFCDLLKEAAKKALPASAPIDDAVFDGLKALLAAIQ